LSKRCEVVGLFATAVEAGDIDVMVTLPTTRLARCREPYEYQGRARFLDDRCRRGPFMLVPTGANGQPAFGCYLPDAAAIAHLRPDGLTVQGDRSRPSPGAPTGR
jgi:RNA polymerase sigma-70 factor (ECF subfamily)